MPLWVISALFVQKAAPETFCQNFGFIGIMDNYFTILCRKARISKLIKNQIGDFERGRMYLHNGKKGESGSEKTPEIPAVKLTT
ncbi:hypothetical protein Y032_0109g92 [Ancylostoma ceylanicum]|nr:hypothetical protein Y032_0109g92 [Ancylostoma ceylanicum]